MKLKNNLNILIYFLIFLPAIISLVYNLYVANNLVVEGIKLKEVEQKIVETDIYNKELIMQIARYSDYEYVAKKAKELKMSPSEVTFISLPDKGSLASFTQQINN